MDKPVYISAAFLLWNIITFALYGADKSKARKKKRRISEKTLILCAFFMGGAGAFLGMRAFRHKTKHVKFNVLVPVAAILNLAVLAAVWYLFFRR